MAAGDLVVVSPRFDEAGAVKMAVHARDVYDARIEVDDLASAVAGCALVIGTTARGGAYRERADDIRELCRRAAGDALVRVADADALPTAFVFGPEDSGLSNEEISVCHTLGYIPSSQDYTSLNLAQAVVVTLYEFRRWIAVPQATLIGGSPREQTDALQVEAMFEQLEDALGRIGFLSEDNPDHIMATLRAMLTRAGLDPREVSVMRGIARQIDWFANGGHEVAREKAGRGDKLR